MAEMISVNKRWKRNVLHVASISSHATNQSGLQRKFTRPSRRGDRGGPFQLGKKSSRIHDSGGNISATRFACTNAHARSDALSPH